MGKLVIGIGTGRCGTMSLSCLLNDQRAAFVTHEMRPLLPWNRNKNLNITTERFTSARQRSPEVMCGDVAFYYLSYLEQILDEFPEVRIIGLRRDRDAMVRSFIAWTARYNWNHWTEATSGHVPSEWDICFPKFGHCSTREGAARYWELYNTTMDQLAIRYSQLCIWPTEALSSPHDVAAMLDHVGFGEDKRIVRCHVNRYASIT